jgi:predicted TIM-barrel enzyme
VTADSSDVREAKGAAGNVPVLANTGVKHENVQDILAIADGAIVGTSLKVDGDTWKRVDPERVVEMMALVRSARTATTVR